MNQHPFLKDDAPVSAKADLDVAVQMQRDAWDSVRMPVVYDSIGIGVQFANVFAYVCVLAHVLEHQIRRLEDLEDRLAGHSFGSQRFRLLERKE